MAEGGSGIWTPGGEHPVGQQPPQEEVRELTPEQLTELMRELKISDFLLSNLSTLAQLAYAKLDRSSRDLEQARLAIEAVRALVTVLQGSLPDQVLRDFAQVVSNLQLAYASAADEQQTGPEQTPLGDSPPDASGEDGAETGGR